ncbi:atherin-like [Mustela nigripes]|uniref:atherin-like n=1 Tax=Mustela nigripes TaxID=77151 RepID=UPI002815982A|nr:atherin-like [Mustela nigripes]
MGGAGQQRTTGLGGGGARRRLPEGQGPSRVRALCSPDGGFARTAVTASGGQRVPRAARRARSGPAALGPRLGCPAPPEPAGRRGRGPRTCSRAAPAPAPRAPPRAPQPRSRASPAWTTRDPARGPARRAPAPHRAPGPAARSPRAALAASRRPAPRNLPFQYEPGVPHRNCQSERKRRYVTD